jgi:C4-dicarboxylate-specific signal transduction histidine kinase
LRLRYLLNIKKKLEETVEERTKSLEEKTEEIKQQNEELRYQREEIGNINKELQNAIEELKSAQQQLIQKEKMSSLGIMAMGVAHEINNPLNYIQNGVKLLEQKVRDSEGKNAESLNELFSIVQEGVNRVNGIVKSLNQFTVENTELVDCDIHNILMNCITILNNRFKENVKLHIEFSDEKCIINGSPASLHQIFFNLITNAEESIENKGNVYLKTSTTQDKVIISISDDGVGMSDEIKSKAFDPFFSTKSPNQATGLGLSIVYALIKELDGTINIESEVNKGTSVTVEFAGV